MELLISGWRQNLSFIGIEKNISIIRIVLEQLILLHVFLSSQHPINNRYGAAQKLFLRYDGYNFKRIHKRFGQDAHKQVDGIGENMGIFTHKH